MSILFGFLGFLIPVSIVAAVIIFLIKISRGNTPDTKSLTVKEILVDIGIFVTLITSVVGIVSIIFSAIDKKFVDVLNSQNYGNTGFLNEDIRVAVSVILVVYPIYLGLAYFKAKHLKNNPDRQNIPATKYVNYVILAVSALFMVGSLVTTIYKYLGGELGAAFFYKVLTVTIISLALAIYNYFNLKRNYNTKSNLPNILAILSLVAVIGAIVYSIKILGSPSYVRKVRFDEKRLTDLSGVQDQVLAFWQRTKTLPINLQEVQGDGFNWGYVIPKDPKSKDYYEYKVVENSKMISVTGKDCVAYYPNKYNTLYAVPSVTPAMNFDPTKATCQMPSKATFEICADFETVRAYDENGIEQTGWYGGNSLGVKSLDTMSTRYYEPLYFNSYDKNPNWNHDAEKYCFKRTIDPLKYPQY